MTKKQRQLLDFISRFISEHGYSPSYREIMNGVGYKSVSTVATHVDNLTMLGALKKTNHSARSLEIANAPELDSQVVKKISAGQEKWLVGIVAERFAAAQIHPPTQKQIDDLFVLVGALHVLGLSEAAASFKAKLSGYR